LKIVFVMTHEGNVRNFEWTLDELIRRGHRVHIAFERRRGGTPNGLLPERELLSLGFTPRIGRCSRGAAGIALRRVSDYVRYLDPSLRQSNVFGERAAGSLPWLVRFMTRFVSQHPSVRTRIQRLLALAERSVPANDDVVRFLAKQRPNVLLVTPLVELGSPQVEYVRAARRLGIPSALLVASWDNLTVKGGIHECPDLVAVWNDAQRREALDLHGLAADRVVVTGAEAYDHWFEWRPDQREAFVASIGLDPARPYILYLGSSGFIAPDEGALVVRWAEALRRDTITADLQVVVRPHPTNSLGEHRRRLLDLGVVVHPPEGVNPIDQPARRNYLNSVAHAAATAAVNTSAMIEAAILGRPVLAVPAPQFRATQADALHFRHLLPENGGMLLVADSLDEHVAQLRRVLAGDSALLAQVSIRTKDFVSSFVRPFGPTKRASDVVADEIERVAGTKPCAGEGQYPRLTGRVLAGVAAAVVRFYPMNRRRVRSGSD
jgi:hypothetical protein